MENVNIIYYIILKVRSCDMSDFKWRKKQMKKLFALSKQE